MKLDVSLGKYRMICPFMDGSYEIYGVYFFKNGELIMHQSWAKKPTKEDFLEYMQSYISRDNESKLQN